MELELWRYSGGEKATLGFLMLNRGDTWENLCFTCEDEHRAEKVRGETRIPEGRYEIRLRTEGGFHPRYLTRYPRMHKGMLWLQDVPGFSWIYIHPGNDEDDTNGCILVGWGRNEMARTLSQSRRAYEYVYPIIANAIETGERVWIRVCDLDSRALRSPATVRRT